MGTSKSYSPPTKPEWSALKRNITIAANQSTITSTEVVKNIMKEYLNVSGGLPKMASGGSSSVGKGKHDSSTALGTAQRVADFFETARTQGISQAAKEAGIAENLEGKKIKEIIDLLIDHFNNDGSSIDSVSVNHAVSDLFDDLQEKNIEIDNIEKMSTLDILELISSFFLFYIYESFIQKFYTQMEERDIDQESFRDHIFQEIRLELGDVTNVKNVNWTGSQGKNIINKVIQRIEKHYFQD